MKQRPYRVYLAILAVAVASPAFAAKPKKSSQPVDNTPVVTPDTTQPPAGTAAPTGTVQVSTPGSAPAAYAIPVGGAQTSSPQTPKSAPAAPQGPPQPAVMLRAEQCLRANVERVDREEPSAKLAIDMLLADICADEVDAASLYTTNLDALARFNPVSERGRAGLSIAKVDEETGQITAPPNVDVSTAVEAADRSALKISPSLRKYAAELVLNDRERTRAAGKKAR
jgi:hypothetical protein